MEPALSDREILARSLGLLSEPDAARVDAAFAADASARERFEAVDDFLVAKVAGQGAPDWARLEEQLDRTSAAPPARVLRPVVHRARRRVMRWTAFSLVATAGCAIAVILNLSFSGAVLWRDATGATVAADGELRASLLAPRVIEYGSAARFELSPGSAATLKQLPAEGGLPVCELALATGRVDVDLAPHAFSRFAVAAGKTLIRVVGTKFSVELNASDVRVAVDRGQVEVSHAGGEIHAVRAGSVATVPADGRITVTMPAETGATNSSTSPDATNVRTRAWKKTSREDRPTNATAVSAEKPAQECITLKDGTVFNGRIVFMDDLILRIETAFGTYDIKRSQIRGVQYKQADRGQ